MVKKRPVAVTVMGILNIIFGSLSLLAIVCVGLCLGVVMSILMSAEVQKDMPAGINPFKLMWDYPEIRIFFIVSGVLSLFTGTLLLVCGIGLLRMRNWARIGSIIYSVFTILLQLASFYYTIAHFNPAMERWERDYNEKVRVWAQQRGGFVPAQQPSNPMANMLGGVVGTVVGMIYAIVLLIIMLLPNVSAAFRGEPAIGGYERPDEDYYDEGYERRRRDDVEH